MDPEPNSLCWAVLNGNNHVGGPTRTVPSFVTRVVRPSPAYGRSGRRCAVQKSGCESAALLPRKRWRRWRPYTSRSASVAPAVVQAVSEPSPGSEDAERVPRSDDDVDVQVSASTEALAERLLSEIHRRLQESLEGQLRVELARQRAIDRIDLLVAVELVKLREKLQLLFDSYRERLTLRTEEMDRRANELAPSWAQVEERLEAAQERARVLRQTQDEIESLLRGSPHTPVPRSGAAPKHAERTSLVRFDESAGAALPSRQALQQGSAWRLEEEQALSPYWIFFYGWLSALAGLEASMAVSSAHGVSAYTALSGTVCLLLLGHAVRLGWAARRQHQATRGQQPALPSCRVVSSGTQAATTPSTEGQTEPTSLQQSE
jgi:hypothetical protein